MTIAYEVEASGDPGLNFAVYRSSSAEFDSSAVAVGTSQAVPSVDASGLPATSPGLHQVTIPIPGGLPINPKHPYVLVVADPDSASAGQPGSVAAFRKSSLAIVTHGGIQNKAWKKNGPPWATHLANALRKQGYDKVIPFNWVSASSTPGAAAKQAPRLTRLIRHRADKLPAGDPLDLHFIGHSEGAVVNTVAISRIERADDPEIQAGYLEDTLLDPHAANPDAPGRQYSTGGLFGWIAKLAIDRYQSDARDPLVSVPSKVDSAQVFYQQTPANRDHGTNDGVYNLWGQVPVKGRADYYNLTQAKVVHSGKQGVYYWYEHHIVPTLGNGAPGLAESTLTRTDTELTPGGHRATYAGTAEPKATIRLTAGHGHGPLHLVGKTVVKPDGTWTATTKKLDPGTYRIVAESKPFDWPKNEHQAIPTKPLGALVIDRGRSN